jgi:formate/nitrite transporter FocA (FNT family)
VTFVLNVVRGVCFVGVFAVDGLVPTGAPAALVTVAGEITARSVPAGFASGIVGRALVVLLSFLLEGVDSSGSRMVLAYAVGVLLAIGAADHVVVTVLHVVFGRLFESTIGLSAHLAITVVATGRNLLGGLGLVTVTEVAQAIGARQSDR